MVYSMTFSVKYLLICCSSWAWQIVCFFSKNFKFLICSELEKQIAEYEVEFEAHTSTKAKVEELTAKLEEKQAELVSTEEQLSQEKSEHETTKSNLEEVKNELADEKKNHKNVQGKLDKEIANHVSTKKELEVEKEEHKDTKRDLEYAELPFWKKISTDKPGEKPV